jgi:DNA-directed RNA polymerase
MANAELFSPIAYPMLIEPNDWTNERAGGYLLNEVMRGHDMVRRGAGCIQGETPINFLNKIQKVGYRLNPFTIEIAEILEERGIAVGKFIPIVEVPLPPKPVDIAENYDSRKDYRRRAAEAMNQNAESFKKSCRTRMTMEAAKLFKDKDEFFIPWSFDYRGRAYPIPAFLTPQDTDFGKSLLKFSNESFMTPDAEDWLAFQVATTYGLDKAPMHERMQWVQENDAIITAVAEDPIGNISIWEAADEPWQFLAACDEYYHCVISCDRNYTSLPVATDATCSGLQILAGLCRDARTASLVNVLPGDRPQDAYRVVAETALPNVPDSVKPYMDRKTVKRVVMTSTLQR